MVRVEPEAARLHPGQVGQGGRVHQGGRQVVPREEGRPRLHEGHCAAEALLCLKYSCL